MKKYFISIISIALLFGMCLSVYAFPDISDKKKEKKGDVGTTITLVTSGTGDTKEEATNNALRSALEQTYGAFVSSNSQVVNDELVKDEIVSISTGNIVSYEELSFIDSNPKQVSVSAVVSISRLQSYAQNKGMSAELAGNTFAMNLKMEELNKKNQDIALKHMLEQTKLMSQNLFDYELSVGDPEKTPKGVQVPLTIRIKANKNTVSYYDYFHKTFASLAVQKKTGRDVHLYSGQGIEIDGFKQFDGNGIVYELRGEARDPETHNTIYEICNAIGEAVLNCEIVDNLGNVSGFEQKSNYNNVTQDYVTTNKLSFTYHGGTGRSTPLYGYRDDYKSDHGGIFLISRLTRSGTSGFNFWMNAVRPKAGEKLYETKLFLNYTVDEIAKVSKIEVRPKKKISSANTSLNNDVAEFAKCMRNISNNSLSEAEREKSAEKVYELAKKIISNPESQKELPSDFLKPLEDLIKQIEETKTQ